LQERDFVHAQAALRSTACKQARARWPEATMLRLSIVALAPIRIAIHPPGFGGAVCAIAMLMNARSTSRALVGNRLQSDSVAT
jgi:hypothetical protein